MTFFSDVSTTVISSLRFTGMIHSHCFLPGEKAKQCNENHYKKSSTFTCANSRHGHHDAINESNSTIVVINKKSNQMLLVCGFPISLPLLFPISLIKKTMLGLNGNAAEIMNKNQ